MMNNILEEKLLQTLRPSMTKNSYSWKERGGR